MALLGFQFVITLIVALFLQKLSPYISFARWILCSKLLRYRHPTDEQLRASMGKPVAVNKGKKRKGIEKQNNNGGSSHDENLFSVPCNIDIELQQVPIEEQSLYTQYKYVDYKWLLDFTSCAVLVFVAIEITAVFRPQIYVDEYNVGFVWCMLVVYFALRELISLTAAYWRSEDGGERAMAISFGFFFFIVALGVLVIDENVLDFGLEEGYQHFAKNLETLYRRMDVKTVRPPSIWGFKVVLAFLSGVLGAVLGFPGIRYANMHLDSMYYAEKSKISKLFLNAVFFSPLLICFAWIPPLSKELLYTTNGRKKVMLFSDEQFVFLRIHVFVLIVLFRLFASRQLLQSHLNTARQKFEKFKMETGRITNRELQRTVARIFYYLPAAALQYFAPLILMLFLGVIMRTTTYQMKDTPLQELLSQQKTTTVKGEQQVKYDDVKLIRALFSVKLTNGVCSYFAWWVSLTYFITSCFGLVYLKYLS